MFSIAQTANDMFCYNNNIIHTLIIIVIIQDFKVYNICYTYQEVHDIFKKLQHKTYFDEFIYFLSKFHSIALCHLKVVMNVDLNITQNTNTKRKIQIQKKRTR